MSTYSHFELVSIEDTKKFTFNRENRAFNHAHLEKIKKQMMSSFDVIPPITVNTVTNNIIDGQHRLKAYQSLVSDGKLGPETKLKVMFVNIPVDDEKRSIVDANTNSKNWILDDYILSYTKAGLTNYMRLNEWCLKHILTSEDGKSKFRYGAAIITGKRSQNELKNGTFSFTDEDIKRADIIHAEMLEIAELFEMNWKGNWIEALAVSWSSARGMHDFRTWMRELKLKKKKFMGLPKVNSRDWDNIFSQIHLAIDKKAA